MPVGRSVACHSTAPKRRVSTGIGFNRDRFHESSSHERGVLQGRRKEAVFTSAHARSLLPTLAPSEVTADRTSLGVLVQMAAGLLSSPTTLLPDGNDAAATEIYGFSVIEVWIIAVGSSVGIVTCLTVLVFNSCWKVLQQPPGRYVRSRTLFTLLHTIALLSFASYVIANNEVDYDLGRRQCCRMSMVCLDFHIVIHTLSDTFETGIVMWQLAMSIDILSIVRDPFRPNRHKRKAQVVVYLATLLVPGVIVSVYLSQLDHTSDCATFTQLLLSARDAIAGVEIGVIGFALAVTTLLVCRLRTGLAISQRSRNRVTRQLLCYTIGYSLADAASLALNVRNVPSGYRFSVLALRGAWDFGVWLLVNATVLFPRGCRRAASTSSVHGLELHESPFSSRSRPTSNAAALAAALGGSELTDWQRASHVEDGRRTTGAGALESGQPSARAASEPPLEKLDVAEELRYELVLLTAHGIGECTSDQWQDNVRKEEELRSLRKERPAERMRRLSGGLLSPFVPGSLSSSSLTPPARAQTPASQPPLPPSTPTPRGDSLHKRGSLVSTGGADVGSAPTLADSGGGSADSLSSPRSGAGACATPLGSCHPPR